jgi:type I restriction-modification system DNA methylase subunit
MPQTKLISIANEHLFSNDYLKNRLPKRTDWKRMAPQRELLDKIVEIFDRAGILVETANEKQVRDNIVNKVLEVVNPHFLSDQNLPTGGAPDYIFFEKVEAKQRKDLTLAIAVGDAKEPGKSFDKAVGERSPVRQVYDYMADTPTRWGILTDGRRWRLLNHDSPTNKYFEVDLYDLTIRGDREEWLYFYNLFRRESFVQEGGFCFLDRVKEESTKYAQEVGEELKERAFSALLELARGFAAWPENKLEPSDMVVRDRVRKSCFILLYRLLFVFFAEARGLLPRESDGYRNLSLEAIREKVRGASRNDTLFHANSRRLWIALRDLFRLIDQGDEELGIPPYNGGLFSRESGKLEHIDFLLRYDIADKHLARAIDFLGTAPSLEKRHEFVNVDYAGLETRHLGSIYEGLLEFQLGYADTDKVAVKGKKGEIWIDIEKYDGKTPVEKYPPQRRVMRGELYLKTKKHERKITGSYYTPDQIVKYIVRNTVGAELKVRLKKARKEKRRESEEVLSIRVCDPAMGSGHFLVEATEYLADELLRALEEDQKAGLEPLGDITLEWAKREVLRHCIYGVDINDLAVELSKVSLWLSTVSGDKPLSFLDHRLKCGNSLIGAKLSDLKDYPKRTSSKKKKNEDTSLPSFIAEIFIDRLISKAKEFEEINDDLLENIKRKEKVLEEFKQLPEYKKTKAIADVRTAAHFDNVVEPTREKSSREVYFDLVYSLDYPSNWEPKTRTAWFKSALETAESKKFFHWELEYPEVFFEKGKVKNRPGFDVVVGNPPYVNALELARTEDPLERDFVRSKFVSAKGAFDLYIPFLELGQQITRPGGRSGLITPNKFLSAPYGKALREHLSNLATLERVLDASQANVFEDPSVYPIVTVFLRLAPRKDAMISVKSLGQLEGPLEEKGEFSHSLLKTFPDLLWSFLLSGNAELISRLTVECRKLEDIAKVQASTTAAESAKFTSSMFECNGYPDHKRHFAVLNTGLIDRYESRWGINVLTHAGRKFKMPCFKRDDTNLSEMRRVLYGTPKLIVAKVAYVPEVYLDSPGEIAGLNVNFIFESDVDLRYLLAMMNSRAMNHIYREFFGALTMQKGYAQFQAPQLRLLPIPNVEFKTPDKERNNLVAELQTFYESAIDKSAPSSQHFKALVNRTSICISSHSKKSDVAHDFLAYLADQMRRMHSEKHEVARTFLDWVESPLGLGVNIDDLKNRKKFDRFYENPNLGTDEAFRELEDTFAKSKIRIRPKQLSGLKREYEKVVVTLKPLLNQLLTTETVIDYLVYRLYDLSKSEVARVEECTEDEVSIKYCWPT